MQILGPMIKWNKLIRLMNLFHSPFTSENRILEDTISMCELSCPQRKRACHILSSFFLQFYNHKMYRSGDATYVTLQYGDMVRWIGRDNTNETVTYNIMVVTFTIDV